jgi:hypothetical protein
MRLKLDKAGRFVAIPGRFCEPLIQAKHVMAG